MKNISIIGVGFLGKQIAEKSALQNYTIYIYDIKSEGLEKFVKIKDDNQLFEAVQQWRESNNIPAYVLLTDSDNKLFINLENLMCIKTLFSVTKNRPSFQLTEFLYNPGHAIVKGPEGVFTNEFVLCFYNAGKLEALKKK